MNISIENIEEKNLPLQHAIVDYVFNDCIQVKGKREWFNYYFEIWMNGNCFLVIYWKDKNSNKEHKHKINYNVFVEQHPNELSNIISQFVKIETDKMQNDNNLY